MNDFISVSLGFVICKIGIVKSTSWSGFET